MNIHSPRQLIAAIPHLLGFHPTDSLVAVVFDDDNIESIVRLDWNSIVVEDFAQTNASIRKLNRAAVVLVAYSEEADVQEQFEQALSRLEECALLDSLHVASGRWRSTLCSDAQCCPALGNALDEDVDEVSVDFVFAGSAPFSSRESLEQSIKSRELTLAERQQRDDAFASRGTRDELDDGPKIVSWLDRVLTSGSPLSWPEVNTICHYLSDFHFRDAVLRALYDNPQRRLPVRSNLMDLVARVPEEFVPVVATLLAGCAWLDGNGAITRMAIDRALEADADYSLARLLDRALTYGVPPRVWSESLAAVSMNDCLAGAA